jgi:diguanylate cyclase (GGDEF)-like protein
VLLIIGLRLHKWFRQQRGEGAIAYRKAYGTATMIIACLVAMRLTTVLHAELIALPQAGRYGVSVLIAISGYALSNHLMALALLTARNNGKFRLLLGTPEEHVLEFATLCLGGLVGVALLSQPWVTPLILLPMSVLQRGALVRELETVASTDSKTGLFNAIAWEQVTHRELSRAERDMTPAAVMIIDLDRFKLVNDTFGHMAGDIALRAVGGALTAALRDYDTIGRFGGEEFIALMPGVSPEEAGEIAERARQRISELRMAHIAPQFAPGSDAVLSVSIGVACFPVHGGDVPTLLHAADRALYVAKHEGRNRVCFADLPTQGSSTLPQPSDVPA